jgi:transposase
MSTGKRRKRRIFEPEFKVLVVKRLMAGEKVGALSREFGISASHLAMWSSQFRRDGPQGLRRAGRPRKLAGAIEVSAATHAVWMEDIAAARDRISELECKIGQQQVELDFFRRALRQVRQAHRPNDGPGVRISTPSSRR